MTMWARAVRCLVLFALLATGAVSLFVGAARVAIAASQGLCTTAANLATFAYDALRVARDDVRGLEGIEAPAALLYEARDESASPPSSARDATTTLLTRDVATEAAGTGGIETAAHGATRIAGEAATRGGVLSEAEIGIVREAGTVYNQSNGAIARVLQQADGRFSVVEDGDRGLIRQGLVCHRRCLVERIDPWVPLPDLDTA